jgi:phospholipid-binding lipoprotein MlaA
VTPRRALLALALALACGPGLARAAEPASGEPSPQAAAVAPEPPPPALVEDPLEGLNRRLFGVDLTINRVLAGQGRILAMAKWIPVPVRAGLYNAFDNLEEPGTAANCVLQVKFRRAARSGGRFAINSTVGVLGLIDVAKHMGLKRTREDFGQTLATWGVTSGPYLYFPLAGPTDLRDALSGVVDSLFVPGHWFPMTTPERAGMKVIKYGVAPSTIGIRQIARGAAADGDTKDEYATLRQLFFDQRADQIADRPNLADDPVGSFPELKPKKGKKKDQSITTRIP